MALKDIWKDLQDTTNGIDGDDVTAAPINLIAHSVIEIEEDIFGLDARIDSNESAISQNKADINTNRADIDTNKENISENSDEISKLKELIIKTDASGVDFNITDAAQMPLESLNIYGKTNQVHTTGKNLFAFTEAKTITASGLTMTTGINNSYFDISGTATGVFSSEVLSCELPAGTYTMSMYGLVGVDDYVYLKNKNTNTIAVGTLKNGKTKSFTITETTSFAVAPVIRNTTPYTYNNTPVYIQIEQGETATDYEPYTNGISTPCPEYAQPMEIIATSGSVTINVDDQEIDIETPNGLSGVPVSSNGNYTDENGQQWVCDEIDFEKGVYIKRINSYTITGVENWTKSATQASTDGHIRYDVLVPYQSAKGSDALCNYYPYKGTNITRGIGTWVYSSGANYLNLRIVTSHTTLDEFKAFLVEKHNSDAPVTMQYILAEPIETAISDEVLEVYKGLHTNKPTTHIFNDANAYVKVGYIADTKTYIDSEIKSEVNQNFANALKGKATGEAVVMNDVSPIEHEMSVKVESENLYVEDLSAVKLSALGKNLFKPEADSTTTNNVTITRNEDNSYTLNGTTTENVYIWLGNIPANDDFTYYVSGGASSDVQLACQLRIDTTNINTVFSVGDVQAINLSQTSNKPYNNFNLIVVIKAGVTLSNVIVKPMISLSPDSTYEPYVAPIEYTVNADGTVEGVTSLYPATTLVPDTSGVVINAEYNKDINKAFAELQQAIISLGGNV